MSCFNLTKEHTIMANFPFKVQVSGKNGLSKKRDFRTIYKMRPHNVNFTYRKPYWILALCPQQMKASCVMCAKLNFK